MSPLAFWLQRRRRRQHLEARAELAATLISSHGGGNSRRAQARVRSTFASPWQPWARCVARSTYAGAHCQLRRGHLGRHAHESVGGFDLRYFDTPKDGTP